MRVNCKGIFSFVLVLIFLIGFIGFAVQENYSREKIGNSINTAIEMEQESLLRKMLEENVDMIIEAELENCLQNGIIHPLIIKQMIAGKLINFFQEMNAKYGIEFFIKKNSLLFEMKTELNEAELMQLFAVNVINFGNGFFAECTFHGGIAKNREVIGEIVFKNSKTVFEIPMNYSVKTTVII